jgi:hypothetical protein
MSALPPAQRNALRLMVRHVRVAEPDLSLHLDNSTGDRSMLFRHGCVVAMSTVTNRSGPVKNSGPALNIQPVGGDYRTRFMGR